MKAVSRTLCFLFALLVAAGPYAPCASASQDGLFAGFEDGSTQGFAPRGGSEILEVTDETAHAGKYSLKVTGRAASWNGPSLRIDGFVEPDCEYTITAWVRAISPATSNFRLSTQISEGSAASYINLATAGVASGVWKELTGTCRYSDTGYVTVYVENDNASAEYYIDDISVVKKEGSRLNVDLSLPSLAEIYKDDFLIGNVFSAKDLKGERFDLISRQFNALTAENAMKPESVAPSAGDYAFGPIDAMIASAQGAGFQVHGHTLVWHQQSPAWLTKGPDGKPLARAQAEGNLAGYVGDVAGHFAGKVVSWDVVNEAIMDNPANPRDWRASLRQADWLNAFANGAGPGESGADYVERAFLLAREADPAAKLYYNDYNLDGQAKAIAVAGMVAEINNNYSAQGNARLLIEGIGMQAHYHMRTKPEDVEASLKRFIALGVEVSISELDVFVTDGSEALTPAQEKKQAELYARLFLVFKKYAAHIERVTFWGLDDGSSWRKKQFPLLFDASLAPKEAFHAVADPEGYLGMPQGTPAATPAQNMATPGNTPAPTGGEALPAEVPARTVGFPWWAAAVGAGIAAGIAACLLIRRRRKAG